MKTQKKYDKYKIYWAFEKPEQYEIEGAEKIKIDTPKYFVIALNTWHGSTMKKMGNDAPITAFRYKVSKSDVMYAQSNYDIEVFSKAFDLPKEIFALVGLPRNDELSTVTKKEISEIRRLSCMLLHLESIKEIQKDV